MLQKYRKYLCVLVVGLSASALYGAYSEIIIDFFQPPDLVEMFRTGTPTPQEIEVAVRAGADVNAKDNAGRTPLMFAVESSERARLILLLLDAGADAAVRNNGGRRAIDMIAGFGSLRGTEALRRLEAASRE